MTEVATRVVYSTKHHAELVDYPIEDIDRDRVFSEIFDVARPFTMTNKEALYALHQAVKYVSRRNISGDIVECGVWRGGSSLLAALTLRALQPELRPSRRLLGRRGARRKVWLYGTFEGMTTPTARDVDLGGHSGQAFIDDYGDDGRWCYCTEDEVRTNLLASGLTEDDFVVVKGDVMQTLAQNKPKSISVLRLDTDWYESTRRELEVMYPLLAPGGVLIIDDYGHWQGAREAVDEYFSQQAAPILLQRTTYAVRTGVKT